MFLSSVNTLLMLWAPAVLAHPSHQHQARQCHRPALQSGGYGPSLYAGPYPMTPGYSDYPTKVYSVSTAGTTTVCITTTTTLACPTTTTALDTTTSTTTVTCSTNTLTATDTLTSTELSTVTSISTVTETDSTSTTSTSTSTIAAPSGFLPVISTLPDSQPVPANLTKRAIEEAPRGGLVARQASCDVQGSCSTVTDIITTTVSSTTNIIVSETTTMVVSTTTFPSATTTITTVVTTTETTTTVPVVTTTITTTSTSIIPAATPFYAACALDNQAALILDHGILGGKSPDNQEGFIQTTAEDAYACCVKNLMTNGAGIYFFYPQSAGGTDLCALYPRPTCSPVEQSASYGVYRSPLTNITLIVGNGPCAKIDYSLAVPANGGVSS